MPEPDNKHPPNHVQTASGLRDHLAANSHHSTPSANDAFPMPTTFTITTAHTGIHPGPTLHQSSADLLNSMLTTNQTSYHVYFSETGGFHNHRAHHLLAAYALGATPAHLQLAHDTMQATQRGRFAVDEERVREMEEPEGFKRMLGDDAHYHEFLVFFWRRFEERGWRSVVNEFLFEGTEGAEDLGVRLFAGLWHNLILLGYGIEFEQPGIVAEGLAGACVHNNLFGPYLRECENLANASSGPCKPLMQLLQEIRENPILVDKDHWQGGNSFAYSDDVISNAPPGMAKLAAQWKLETAEELSARSVELINVNAFIAGGAQRPNKVVKIDFVNVHHINASIFLSTFIQQEWMTDAAKIRLLEWYGRIHLLLYAASLGPQLLPDEISEYKPKESGNTWSSLIQRCLVIPDDGHLAKLLRALAHGERVSGPLEHEDAQREKPILPVKGGMWLQIANMAVDSAEAESDIIKRWVRGAGSDEAWAEVADR